MSVDTERFHPVARPASAEYFPPEDTNTRILFVGNASKEKGLLDLLAVLVLLKHRNIMVSLVATIENQCGIKEYAAGYKQARAFVRRMKMEGQVRFMGLVDSMERLYGESDVVVIPWKTSRGPSDYPMVVLEAMAMGKCVVSSPVGGAPELLAGGEAGILTRDFSIESIATAIELAIRDPQMRRKLETNAMEKARSFSVSAAAEHLLVLYDELMRKKPLRRGSIPDA
jgi:glycosyltransferase involved in cell wall biosynthesis